MKALVVYYSRTGNTKKVATAIANGFKCDIEEIKDTKNRSGIWGWLMSGRDASKKLLTNIKDVEKDLDSYDIVIIGGPIWAWNLSAPVRTFLSKYAHQIRSAAFSVPRAAAEERMRSKRWKSCLENLPSQR